MVYSEARATSLARSYCTCFFLASNNSNDDCQHQQQQQLCLAATALSRPFSSSLASFECHFCPCGLRHFNFNLMQATNKQIKCPNAPYEYERAAAKDTVEKGGRGEAERGYPIYRWSCLSVQLRLTHLHRNAIFISRQDKCHNRIKRTPAAQLKMMEKSYNFPVFPIQFSPVFKIVLSNEALHWGTHSGEANSLRAVEKSLEMINENCGLINESIGMGNGLKVSSNMKIFHMVN